MQINNPPVKLVLPFGENDPSGRATIPVTTSSPGYASLNVGFPPITRTPKAAGGIPPRGVDMNGILYAISAATRWASAGAGYKYDATFANDTNVGGYPAGARVLNAAGNGYWINLVDGNTTNPDTGGAGWVSDWSIGTTSANGYFTVPILVGSSYVNFIVQWASGVSTTVGDTTQTVTFPTAFPNACLHLGVTTLAGSTTFSDAWYQEISRTLTNCVVVAQWTGAGNVGGGVTPKIFAIGY